MRRPRCFLGLAVVSALALSGCATLPTGPSVMVWPAAGKPFEQFQTEDATCRQWAGQQIGLSPQETVNQNTAAGAVLGTVLGAGLGAAIGAASGNPGIGAAIGAGSGLLGGTAVGANAGHAYGWDAQRRYDIAYQQCMYANGNQIPGAVQQHRRTDSPPAAAPAPARLSSRAARFFAIPPAAAPPTAPIAPDPGNLETAALRMPSSFGVPSGAPASPEPLGNGTPGAQKRGARPMPLEDQVRTGVGQRPAFYATRPAHTDPSCRPGLWRWPYLRGDTPGGGPGGGGSRACIQRPGDGLRREGASAVGPRIPSGNRWHLEGRNQGDCLSRLERSGRRFGPDMAGLSISRAHGPHWGSMWGAVATLRAWF